MKTDRLNLIQLYGIDDEKTLENAMPPGGSLEMCEETRFEGLVGFMVIISHKPHILVKAIETNEFDTILVPLNIVTRQALGD